MRESGRYAPAADGDRRPAGVADHLLTAAAVRERCGLVFAAAERGETRHFAARPATASTTRSTRVVGVTRRRYPDLAVPFHSRWRHFSAGGVDRARLVAPGADPAETARARLDLAIVSVLLDAGAGPGWRYREAETGLVLARSEGLAVASLRAMQAGLFSADPRVPWRADAAALASLIGRPARRRASSMAGKIRSPGWRAGPCCCAASARSRRAGPTCSARRRRLGNLYDFWLAQRDALPAPDMLRLVLRAFGPIWPGRLSLGGVPLGDCGRHPAVPGDGSRAVSQAQPMAGLFADRAARRCRVHDHRYRRADRPRRIPQWRAVPRYRGHRRRATPTCRAARSTRSREEIVEWRALTVALLDRLAERVRERLGLTRGRVSARQNARRRQLGRRPRDRRRAPSGRRAAAADRQRRHGFLIGDVCRGLRCRRPPRRTGSG